MTGVLSNQGISVAKATGIDPATVDYAEYSEAFSEELGAIGHDWKSFDLSAGWSIPDDRVYFVKTANNDIWKLQFFDFEGSSTGTTTLEKTLVGNTTSTSEVYENLKSFGVFPNPANDYINITFEINSSVNDADVLIFNTLGQVVNQQKMDIQSGLNVHQISLDYPKGMYQVRLKVGKEIITQSIIIQ